MATSDSRETTGRVSAYTFDAPDGWEHETIRVEATGRLDGGRFVPDADVWAIRKLGWALNRDGDWEWEPLPSSRDDEFYSRCRYTLDEALALAPQALARDNLARSDSR